MVEMRAKADAEGQPTTDAEIANIVLRNEGRSDCLIGRGHGHVPKGRGRRRSTSNQEEVIEERIAEMRRTIEPVHEKDVAKLQQKVVDLESQIIAINKKTSTELQDQIAIGILSYFKNYPLTDGTPPPLSPLPLYEDSQVRLRANKSTGVDPDAETEEDV